MKTLNTNTKIGHFAKIIRTNLFLTFIISYSEDMYEIFEQMYDTQITTIIK